MTTMSVPLAGARVPTDVAPDPTFAVGTLLALLVVGFLLVSGIAALVTVLVRRSRSRSAGSNQPGSGIADRDGPVP